MKALARVGCLCSAFVLGFSLAEWDWAGVLAGAVLLIANVCFYTENRR